VSLPPLNSCFPLTVFFNATIPDLKAAGPERFLINTLKSFAITASADAFPGPVRLPAVARCLGETRMTRKRDLIIAVDFGTTGLRVGVVRSDLGIEALSVQSYPTRFELPGHAEQDPADWWSALRLALKELHGTLPHLAHNAAALVFSAQLCGVVPADGDGTPLRPCLIWLDKRAADLTRKTMGGFPSAFGYGVYRLVTSLWLTNGAPSLNGMDPPGKMMWLQKNEPAIFERTHKFLDVKDWLVHKACGKFVTTADSANLTWMMDTRPARNCWSPYLMTRFGIPSRMLPDIVPGTSSPGGLTQSAAIDLQLPEGLPVIAGCGDVCAAALGSGGVGDGELHISLGTSSWIGGFYPGRRLSASEGYATIACPVGNRPLLIATQESAGSCLEWFDRLAGETRMAGDNIGSPGSEPPLFLPWLAGERVPVDDNRLRGAFLGLSLMHGRDSLAQAVLEGVALNTRWAYRSVSRQKGTVANRRVPLVGGAAQNPALCQALADCLGAELTVGAAPRLAGVQGAAAIAAAHLGYFKDTWSAAATLARPDNTVYSPDPKRAAYFDHRFDLFLHAYRQTSPWFRSSFRPELISS
jgi:xylulokinase